MQKTLDFSRQWWYHLVTLKISLRKGDENAR